MAAPNIVNVTSIYGKTMGVGLSTTTTTDILTCGANNVLKINSITVANVDGTNNADATVYFSDQLKKCIKGFYQKSGINN